MIRTGDKIGYISRRYDESGKATYKFIESKIQSIYVGKKVTTVKIKGFNFRYDYDELVWNTETISGGNLALVGEPFICTEEQAEHYKKLVDYWNEHGAVSILDGEV